MAHQAHQARLVNLDHLLRSEARGEQTEESDLRPDSHKAREAREAREARGPAVVLQLIDRTVEEFGEDDGDDGDYPSFYHHYGNLLLPPPPPGLSTLRKPSLSSSARTTPTRLVSSPTEL